MEEYDATDSCDTSGLKSDMYSQTGIECDIRQVPFGKITPYRMVREAKSIIKVMDKRKASRQVMPCIL